MRINITILLILISFFISCRTHPTYKESKSEETYEVQIMNSTQFEEFNEPLLKIYSKKGYDLLFPLNEIKYYVWENSFGIRSKEHDLNKIIDSLNNYSKNTRQKIITSSYFQEENKDNKSFDIYTFQIFLSAKYFIYNTKNKTFVTKVKIYEYHRDAGPFATSDRIKVFIDELVYWELQGES